MKKLLMCPCGTAVEGIDDDDLVEKSFAHLRERHPHMADDYTRDHILFMARRL